MPKKSRSYSKIPEFGMRQMEGGFWEITCQAFGREIAYAQLGPTEGQAKEKAERCLEKLLSNKVRYRNFSIKSHK